MRRNLVFALPLISTLWGVAPHAIGQQAAQPPYTPAVPIQSAPTVYGGYWDTHASTAEEGAMRGMAGVISAKGDYNLSTSAAAVNYTQAQKNYIENRQQATQTYFDMQEVNRTEREAKRSPRLSQEQLVRIAADAAPNRLSSNEIDVVSGKVYWPALLQKEEFASERAALEQLSLKRAQYGSLGLSDHEAAGKQIEAMSIKLKGLIKSVSASQYVAAKNFLKSVMYAVTQTQLS